MTSSAPALTLVHGPEALLRDRAVARRVAALRADDSAAEVHDLSAVGLEPGRVAGLAAPSLFGGASILVVRDLSEASDDIAAELKALFGAPPDDVKLVLVHAGGVKGKALLDAVRKAGAEVIDCKALKWDSDKLAFVQAEFSSARRRIDGAAAQALLDALGSDLRELASACSQLIADTDGTITSEVVERYHAGRVEVTGFKVADAAVEGRHDEALRLMRHALATGVDPVPLNAALAAGLRAMARVAGSRLSRPDDVARELGLAPFVVKKAKGQLAGWTPTGVEDAIVAVARADEQIKGGGTDQVYALECAVRAIVSARSAS